MGHSTGDEPLRGVYLLHLTQRVQGGQHYCGYASDVDKRVQLHQAGYGAEYTRQAHRRGVSMQLVRVWPDSGKDLEYAIKHTTGGPGAFCPICRATPLD
jgi:predicted GIY-YIG superfamily endonuclease